MEEHLSTCAVSDECGTGWLISRVRLRQLLGVLWLLDGLFLLSPRLLKSPALAGTILVPATAGQPALIAGQLSSIAQFTQQNATLVEVVAAIIQIELGLLLIAGFWERDALLGSLLWSLVTWYAGEGLGAVLTGGAGIVTGAPGPVLLYTLLTLAVYQRRGQTDPKHEKGLSDRIWVTIYISAMCLFLIWLLGQIVKSLISRQPEVLTSIPGALTIVLVASCVVAPPCARFEKSFSTSVRGLVRLRCVLAACWIGGALLQLQPYWWNDNHLTDALSAQSGLGGMDGLIADPVLDLAARLSSSAEVLANLVVIVLCLAVGVGLVMAKPEQLRMAGIAAVVAGCVLWIFAQGMGLIFSGATTDFNSGLLLAVLALACLPETTSTAWRKQREADLLNAGTVEEYV